MTIWPDARAVRHVPRWHDPQGLRLHFPRTGTPVINTAITCLVVGLLAGSLPLEYLSDMVSIGTLTAFAVVSLGVIILRRRNPNMQRGFRVPLYPVIPIISIIACLYLVTSCTPSPGRRWRCGCLSPASPMWVMATGIPACGCGCWRRRLPGLRWM
ncbi:MAG: hypothetical protein U1U88_001507 [Lawsonella clevelandensis]